MPTEAKIIRDSIAPNGSRLTTFEVKLHRFVLAELNTHRAFSRNSASSRAIPIKKQIERVKTDPALPLHWGKNQPGMQADGELNEEEQRIARFIWLNARDLAVDTVQALDGLGLHKQVANRLLEPFMWHTVIISSTAAGLENFFQQRATAFSPLAQPEMRAAADTMLLAYNRSMPNPLDYGDWHWPYIETADITWCRNRQYHDGLSDMTDLLRRLSVARCARVSYLTHDGEHDPNKDLDLYSKLVSAKPMHASPLEHVATPSHDLVTPGNFDGWRQLRHAVEGANQQARK